MVPLAPPGLVTTTSTEPAACAGTVAVMVVALVTLTLVAATPSKVIVAPEAKLFPVMVTIVPPAVGPVAGLTSFYKIPPARMIAIRDSL